MGAQNLGLGILLEAKDLASGTLGSFSSKLLEVVGGTSEAGKKIKANMKEAGLGLSLFAAGAAGLAALSPAVEAAGKFRNGIAEITTLTDEASLGFDAVAKSVLGMNATFGGGTAAQTKAMYDGISAGAANAAEATALLTSSNKLAVAGKTEVSVALDGLTSSMNAYGVSFANAAEFSDALFVAVQKGKTTIPELAGVIGRVAPTASALGIGFGELNAAISAVTAKGLKTEEAATGIKAALANIINPAGDAAAEAQKLGIKFTAAEVRAKGFAGLLAEITSSSRFNKDSLAKLFSSVEGLNAVLALTANGSAKFNDALAAMATKGGAADKAFQTMAGQLAFSEKRMEGLIENAKILIGDALVPAKQAVVGFVNTLLDGFNRIPTPIRNFLVQAFAVASVLLVVVGGAMALKATIALVGSALSALGVTAGGVTGALLPIVGTVALVGLALYGLKRVYDENLGGFADRVNAAVASVKLAFSALGQLFESGAFSGAVMEEIDKAENSGLKSFALNVWGVGERIKAFFSAIGTGFTASLGAVQPAIDTLLASVAPIGRMFASLFADSGADANAGAFDRWASAGTAVGNALAKIASVALTIGSYVGQLVSGVVTGVAQMGGVFSGLGDVLAEVWDALGELGDAFGGASESGVSAGEIFFAIGRGLAGVFGMLVGIVRGVVATIAGGIRALASVIGGVVDIIAGIFEGDWDRVWRGAKKVVFGLLQAVMAALGGIAEGIASAVDAIASALGRKTNAADTIRQFRKGLEKDAREWFGLTPAGQPEVAPDVQQKMAAASVAAARGAGEVAASPTVSAQAAQVAASWQAQTAQINAALAAAGGKPPQVTANTTVLVQVNGEDIPSTSSTRTKVAGGTPTAPAGV